MRIATRLLIALMLAVTGIMGVYAVIALRQRAELVSDALARETDTLARALQAVTNNALRDGRFEDLEGVLGEVAEDPETFLVAVLEPTGRMFAGRDLELPECLPVAEIQEPGASGLRAWAECDGRVRWVSLPVREPAQALVVARRATVVERDEAASRTRILLTTFALAGGAAVVILIVLRMTLSRPLEAIMRGVRSVGGPSLPDPIELPRSAGELRQLGNAFNEMAGRLEQKRRTLIHEVEERLTLEARMRTEEKFAALGRLTGGLAHELGTPLNVIGVRAEAILRDPDAPAEGRRQAREIVAEVDRVADLIRSLTHVARRDRLELRDVDLNEVLAEVADEFTDPLGQKGSPPGMQLPQPPVVVRGDRNLLRHAFRNLVANAMQATERIGKEATGSPTLESASVRIRLSTAGGEAMVEVEDDGPGVPEETLDRLFEPFFTTKEVGEGMGLGLAMSRGIMEEHGGTVTVESGDLIGLRVISTLPLSGRDRKEEAP